MDEWQLHQRNGFAFWSIERWLQAGVNMAFSTRWGGISEEPFNTCNLGLHVGDDASKVFANRTRFLHDAFEADLGQAVCCQQVHGDKVLKIDKSHQGRGAFLYEESLPDYDAMITDEPGVYLLTFYADCIPVYFFDPVHRAVGIAHSGWKGTMQQIAVTTLTAMQQQFASRCDEMYAAIGPGIAACCFEITADLAHKVDIAFSDFHDIIYHKEYSSIYWDLPETNRQMLIKQGVIPDHIISSKLCTSCHPEHFFSYRRDQGKTGRMGALIALEY